MTDYRNSHIGTNRGRTYDERYAEGAEGFYWRAYEKPYLQFVLGELAAGNCPRYLDFATGTGRILEIAAPIFPNVVGIDVSSDMLEQARFKAPSARFIRADVTMDNVDVGKFHVVSCFRFILNAQPALRVKALRWIRSVIEDDGVLIINNHLNSWSCTGIVCAVSNLLRGKQHHNRLSHNEVVALMEDCGFVIAKRYDFGIVPAWRNKLWLPQSWVIAIERIGGRLPMVRFFAKDSIYQCRPM